MEQKLLTDTKYLQRLLNFAGYSCGEVDGIRGRKTNKAIEEWLIDEDAYKKKYGALDSRSEQNLSTLLPICQAYIRAWFKDKVSSWAKQNAVEVKIICGTRTYKEQDELYAKGRTTKGPKVTNAKAGYSLHNFGIAFDIGIFDSGKYLTSDLMYDKLFNDCGTPEEFYWGGNFKSLHDAPHYQWNKYGTTSSTIRRKFLT